MKSSSVAVKGGDVIWLTATDNKNWVKIETESGVTGWIYLTAWSEVTLPTGKMKIEDVMTYLDMAD